VCVCVRVCVCVLARARALAHGNVCIYEKNADIVMFRAM